MDVMSESDNDIGLELMKD